MNPWFQSAGAFVIGFLLLVYCAWFALIWWVDYLRGRAAGWYELRREIERNSEYEDDPPPAPWQDRAARPWYVRQFERLSPVLKWLT